MGKDEIITYAVGFGIPRLLYELVIMNNENTGFYAITSTLKNLSLFDIGMEEGVGVLVIIGVLSYQFSSYLILKYYEHKIEKDRIRLLLASTTEVVERIDTYSISKALRRKLKAKYLLEEF
ncbi:hypothetical protein [uncultured Kordia sp.]|uniref:hypothetical protein n=1 Tax=uncultured Kordia sp. TaxID=507699 RepID=UPI00260E1C5F|nr:hypothetical protein [uncultured Kordia sp.]